MANLYPPQSGPSGPQRHFDRWSRRSFLASAAATGSAVLLSQSGCMAPAAKDSVVVYCALDSEYSEPILQRLGKELAISILPKFDVESTKTVGLVNAIIAEAARPRCALFWNNEILNTLRLAERNLLTPLQLPELEAFPTAYRSPDQLWCGFAARCRVLLVNTQLVSPADRPISVTELGQEKWRGKCSLAKPLFGTTATHAAVLFATWGAERAQAFFRQLKANDVQIAGGNKQVAQDVASGVAAIGLTDTDDALWAVRQGAPVEIIYPDQADDANGALLLPNTLALIRNAPGLEHARKLAAALLTPTIEAELATGPSGQIPLHPGTATTLQTKSAAEIKQLNPDWPQVLAAWEPARKFLSDLFAN